MLITTCINDIIRNFSTPCRRKETFIALLIKTGINARSTAVLETLSNTPFKTRKIYSIETGIKISSREQMIPQNDLFLSSELSLTLAICLVPYELNPKIMNILK